MKIFTAHGDLTKSFLAHFSADAAKQLKTTPSTVCMRDEILETHSDLIDEKVIVAESPTKYTIKLTLGVIEFSASYRDFIDAHQDYSFIRLMIADAISYRNSRAKAVGCLILARYSTRDSSWQCAYINDEVAFKHIRDNALIHFGNQWDEETETANVADIRLKLDQREGIIEMDDWSVELEYGETIYTE